MLYTEAEPMALMVGAEVLEGGLFIGRQWGSLGDIFRPHGARAVGLR